MTDTRTIGGLRDTLTALDQTAHVYIDNRRPTALSSYRGYYEQLAIERRDDVSNERTEIDARGKPFELNMAGYGTYRPGHHSVRIVREPKVGDLVIALGLALDKPFEGYKGGQYVMREDTDLWVSEYGDCDQLRVARVESLPGRVDLWTVEEEW